MLAFLPGYRGRDSLWVWVLMSQLISFGIRAINVYLLVTTLQLPVNGVFLLGTKPYGGF